MSYFDEVEFAAKNVIELIGNEYELLGKIVVELESLRAKVKVFTWDFESSDLHEDFSDRYVMAAFHRMAQARQEYDQLKQEIDVLEVSIGSKQVAVQALAGALLQIAKQGISLVHGSLDSAPDGRDIGSTPLKEVIWQARNQALHYEDGSFHAPVVRVFEQLEADFGAEFSLTAHPQQSRARQIVSLLGWSKIDVFQEDLKTLGL